MINAQILQGQWNEIKGSLKEHWGSLTQDDLRSFTGNVDQLVGVIQRKTGETREAVQKYLEEITSNGSSVVSTAVETARDYANRASEGMQDAYDNISQEIRSRYSDAEDVVRSKPAESLAVAFGAGLLAGVIVGLVLKSR